MCPSPHPRSEKTDDGVSPRLKDRTCPFPERGPRDRPLPARWRAEHVRGGGGDGRVSDPERHRLRLGRLTHHQLPDGLLLARRNRGGPARLQRPDTKRRG